MDELPFEPTGTHRLRADGRLASDAPRSPLADALTRHVRLVDGQAWLGDTHLGAWTKDGWRPDAALAPLELRFLADRGVPHPASGLAVLPSPRTDLHTHFAGCIGGPDLVRIGAAHGVVIPEDLARRAGLDASGDLRLDATTDAVRARYAAALSLPVDVQSTHHDMNRVYDLRRPITKHRPAFGDLCAQIARDYAAMGVVYAELSLFEILDADVLQLAHDVLPAVRAATGVDLRFLAALSRHDDLEWDLDMLERLRTYGPTPCIVGLDVMGHETNSTRAIAPHLDAIGRFVRARRPDLAVRVHAGENPSFPENVRVAVEVLGRHGVVPRIGHGVYGVDDRTLDQLASAGVIVEFNLDSNYALNNVRDAVEVPLARYVRAGVPVVLGTDGYGIYHGTAAHQARGAALAGLTDGSPWIRTEDAVLAARASADARLDWALEVPPTPGPVHFTAEVADRLRVEATADRARLDGALAALGLLALDPDGVDARFPGARWVSVAGSWRHHWEQLGDAQRAHVDGVIGELVDRLASADVVLITGGTVHGVEGRVHAHARRAGVPVLAAVVDASPPDDLDDVTAAMRVGRTLWEKAARLYALVAERAGAALFVGGGQIVGDELRIAANLRIARAWMADVPGASGSAAVRWPGRAFRTGAEALERLAGAPARGIWRPGPNPCGDTVVVRRTGPVPEVLLIRRAAHADTEPGRWALPGGFLEPGESPADGAMRELAEETGLDARWLASELVPLGVREGGGRDPRDTPERWVRSHAFRLDLPPALAAVTLLGADDASDARWWPIDDLPPLAFDHRAILEDAGIP